MELSAHGYHLPIACRFVPNDQWLVTHLNPSWKISEVKQWLLAKCLPALFTPLPDVPRPQQRRAVSPITFARRDEVDESEEDPSNIHQEDIVYDDDESEDVSNDNYKYVPPRQLSSIDDAGIIPRTATSAFLPQYTLLSFSTGQILEDHYPLSWYAVYPHELFELHLHSSIVKLPRDNIEDYVQPYFEARVWALRVIAKDDDSGLAIARTAEKSTKGPEGLDYDKERMLRKRRTTKVQWQEKWVVIHKGLFQLCKDRNDRSPTHSAQLSSLISLRGADHLRHMKGAASSLAFASPPSSNTSPSQPGSSNVGSDKHIICAKFRRDCRLSAGNSSWWRRGSRDAGGSEESRKNSVSGADLTSTEEDGTPEDDRYDDHVVIVLKMLDDCAYNNILRILHRQDPASSTFLPHGGRMRSPRRRSYSPIFFASGSGHGTPTASPERPPRSPFSESLLLPRSVRYPEWRLDLVRRARRAGLGDVGRAMEIIMFGRNLGECEKSSTDEAAPPRREDERRGRSRTWGAEIEGGESSSSDESTSEREWEGWEGDLLSHRARRDTSDDSELNWASSWIASSGLTVSPSSEYTFPPSMSRTAPEGASAVPVPRKTLSSYSSADSLLRRTIKRASPRKRRPIPSRSDSPSLLGLRARPRSPLADYSDDDDDDNDHTVAEPQLFFEQSHPQVAYPSRQSSFESSTSNRSAHHPSSRMSLPITMAMTTITSRVSVGHEAVQDKKGKGKAKYKDKSGSRQTRRRSSTVQAPLRPSSKSPQVNHTQASSLYRQSSRTPTNVAGSSGSTSTAHEAEKNEAKQGRIKLSLSFAQVAALGTLTASSGRMPTSATSMSSFESPTFARPEDSD